jgi:ABC-2 type transport system permease protein
MSRRRQRGATKARDLHVRGPWAAVIQCSAFVRKELAEIIRQPRLILLLIVGPFALLVLFGMGYRSESLGLRTMFVGPPDSFYEEAIAKYQDALERFVDPRGYTSDESAAREALADDELDVVVVFPEDPLSQVLAGEHAVIEVLHNKIDPIQTTAVRIASQLAVQEVNASVLTAVVAESQTALRPADELVAALSDAANELGRGAATTDPQLVASQADSVVDAVDEVTRLLEGSNLVLDRLGAGDDGETGNLLAQLADIRSQALELRDTESGDVSARATGLASEIETVSEVIPSVTALDPAVLVQPFESDVATVVPVAIEPADFFTPSSLALLVQHLAITFAALSLVRDRELGLFELLRVGPLSSVEIIVGKTIAYLLVGMVVGVGLLAAAVSLLGVPLAGAVWVAVVAIGLVLLASLSLGLLISLISGSETQAVQWSMLTLLAGLFFGGFFLDLDGLLYPVKALSWFLPVTYGIRLLQDVMLRGVDPAPIDIAGLGALIVLYGGLAIWLLRRQLRLA